MAAQHVDKDDDALSGVELQLEHLQLHDEPSTSMKGENVERTTCTLMSIALQKIEIGEAWAERCRLKAAATENTIEGMSKLARKIETEVTFLKKLVERDPDAGRQMDATKLDQVRSSNLGHLQALAHAAFTLANVTAVLHAMPCVVSGYGRHRLVVDVVANSGQTFVKVVASNRRTSTLMTTQPHASDDNVIEDAEEEVNRFGERTLVHQLNDYVACSEQNPVFYRPASVEVVFYVRRNVQLPSLASSMSKKVTVRTVDEDVALTSLPPPPPPSGKVNLLLEDHHCPSELLNLDVSCMIAYVSALTNGRANFLFAEAVLTDQAECERRCPVKPKLDAWFKGRELVSCRTAIDGFKKIVATVGGKGEKERAHGLLERVRVVEDIDDGHWTTSSPLVYKLRFQSQEDRGRKMKLRSLVIFGTGEALRAVTVTANRGFFRSAESKGVRLAVLLHESRALTEAKEAKGKEISL